MYGKDLNSIIEKIGQILKDKGLLVVLTNISSINNPSLFKEIEKEAVPWLRSFKTVLSLDVESVPGHGEVEDNKMGGFS